MTNVISISTGTPIASEEVEDITITPTPAHLIDAALTALELRLGIRS